MKEMLCEPWKEYKRKDTGERSKNERIAGKKYTHIRANMPDQSPIHSPLQKSTSSHQAIKMAVKEPYKRATFYRVSFHGKTLDRFTGFMDIHCDYPGHPFFYHYDVG